MSHDHHIPTAEHKLRMEPSERLARPFQRFAQMSSAGGLVLLAMTIVAMVWANSRFAESYERVFHDTRLAIAVEHYPHGTLHEEEPNGHGDEPDTTINHADEPVVEHASRHTGQILPASQGGHDEPPTVIEVPEGHSPAAELGHDGHASPDKTYFFMGHGLAHWINDLLMAVFFLVVGLEIKREILVGELASPRRAALPVFAALGGMIAPALIFTAFNWGNKDTMSGWGVPMATDIAFAVGIMSMLGKKVPNSLKVFLLSLAIADDLGALVVIAVFYTESPKFEYLGYAGSLVALLLALNVLRCRWITLYMLIGIPLWYCVFMSGVHATIAGVLLAMTIPAHARVDAVNFSYSTRRALEIFDNAEDDPNASVTESSIRRAAVFAMMKNAKYVIPPLHRMETVLHPWAAFFIIPVFALANAGVPVHGGVGEAISGSVSMGVICGLVIGKPLGITIASLIACKLGVAALPRGVSLRHIIGAGMLGGIGFTMAIFIANLAYKNDPVNLEHAKLAILTGSSIAAVAGALILATCKSQEEPEPDTLGPVVGEYADKHS
ncbi:MAG: Na+/H+ antiporter NhaA [Planctomycetota bacterium]|nr:MAG: Na+/H+ antiporter NhaA [Planctomycetota bacterium]